MRTYLIAYDYGMGGLWGFVRANNPEEIRDKYPELQIVRTRPAWMTDEYYDRMALHEVYTLDEVPRGVLRAVIAERNK